MTIIELLRSLSRGGPGFVQIALTNACNAHCRFCGFPRVKPADWIMADPERLRRGLLALAGAGVRYIAFTGGEPLLYPNLEEILTHSHSAGMHNLLCTNGKLLDQDRIAVLKTAGVSHLIISIDAATEQVHDDHRGLPGLCGSIRDLLPYIEYAGIKAVASVTISRLFSDFAALGNFLARLGFKLATFSYPMTRLHSPYLSYAAHDTVAFSTAEMVSIFARLQEWKPRAPVQVLNPSLNLMELQRQLCGRPLHFPCLAGYKYFFIDWHLNVYRCHYLNKVLGPLEDFATLPRERDDCHACLTDCYRDASVQQYLAVVLGDAWEELRRGKWSLALRQLLHPSTFLSMGALMDSRHWLGGNGF
jgi:MoaA/NifB/PqqE/SkfB family radical SAM enzyme